MKIIVCILLAILIFCGFSACELTADMSLWSQDARFICVTFGICCVLGGCMLEYLEPTK